MHRLPGLVDGTPGPEVVQFKHSYVQRAPGVTTELSLQVPDGQFCFGTGSKQLLPIAIQVTVPEYVIVVKEPSSLYMQ